MVNVGYSGRHPVFIRPRHLASDRWWGNVANGSVDTTGMDITWASEIGRVVGNNAKAKNNGSG